MANNNADVDAVILSRWVDAVAFRDAMADLEERLASRLERAAEQLRPWLLERGYAYLEVEPKYAQIKVCRESWLDPKSRKPTVLLALEGIFPYGYKKVRGDQPQLWVISWSMDRDDRAKFREYLEKRLEDRAADWLGDHCAKEYPAGRLLTHVSEQDRLALTKSEEALVNFSRTSFEQILPLGDDVEAALHAALA